MILFANVRRAFKMEMRTSLALAIFTCGICLSNAAVPWRAWGGLAVDVDDRLSCDLCHQIVDAAASSAFNVQTENGDIVPAMLEVCRSRSDRTEVQLCSQFVETSGLTIIDYVQSGQTTGAICTYLQACPSQEEEQVHKESRPEVQRLMSETHGLQADARCELCKFFVQLIDKTLAEPRTLDSVNSTRRAICNSLADPALKSVCVTLDSHVILQLGQGLDPAMACQETNLCPELASSEIRTERISGLSCDVCNTLIEDLAIHFNAVNEGMDLFCSSVNVCHGSGLSPEIPKQSGPPQASLKCEICEFLIDTADQYLQENRSKAAINATIYKLCNDLPASFQTQCIVYAPMIVQLLSEGFDPQKVCTELKLCTGNTITDNSNAPVVHFDKTVKAASLKCEICEFLIDTADQYLKENRSKAAINATIYKLCNDMPATFKPMCLSSAPQIVAALAQGFDPQKVCTEIKLCTGNGAKHFFQRHAISEVASPYCILCEFIIELADDYLKNKNFTPAEANNTVYSLCDNLPASFRGDCYSFAPKLVAILVSGVDPDKACTEIKLCASGQQIHRHKMAKWLPITPKVAGIECTLCEFVVAQADAYIKNKNYTPAEVNNTVYKTCQELPVTFQSFCFQYAPDIVRVLINGVDPEKACTEIGLCSGTTEKKIEKIEEIQVAGIECTLCEFVVAQADAYIKNKNFTPAEVNNTVYQICQELPVTFQSFCFQYAPDIVRVLINGVDPEKACTEIGLCSGTTEKKIEEIQVAGIECTLCEFVVAQLDAYIKNKNYTPAEVNNTVYQICQELPVTFQSFCFQYAPEIVKAVVNGVDPQKACTEIKLCTGTMEKKIEKIEEIQVAGIECTLCEFVVTELDAYIKNKNYTPAEVNSTVYKICQELPVTFQSFCFQYAPEIVKAVVNGVDPQKACTEIKLCTGTTEKKIEKIEEIQVAGIECTLCEFVVAQLDAYIKNKNYTPAEVNNTVYQICQELPVTFQSFCFQYAPEIVKAVVNGVDPQKACTEIKLCTGTPVEKRKEEKVSGECMFCTLLVGVFNGYLKDLNQSPEDLRRAVNQACDLLTHPIRTACYSQAPGIVAMLVEGLDPKLICTELQACVGPQTLTSFLRGLPQVKSLECEACKVAMATLDDDLYRNEDKVKQLVENVCHRLPPPTDQKCLDYVEANFDELWEKLLSKVLSPDGVCELLKLCP